MQLVNMNIFHRISQPAYACTICMQEQDRSALTVDTVFGSNTDFYEHVGEFHLPEGPPQRRETIRRQCLHCPRSYVQSWRHYLKFHSKSIHRCIECGERHYSRRAVLSHAQEMHSVPLGSGFREIESAFSRRLQTLSRSFAPMSLLSIEDCFRLIKEELTDLLQQQLAVKQMLQFSLVVFVQYRREDPLGGVEERTTLPVRSSFRRLYLADAEDRLRRILQEMESKVASVHETIVNRGSDWRMDYVTAINVEVGKLVMAGGCGSRNRKFLMRQVPAKKRKYLCNVSNYDPSSKNDCFFHAVAMGLCENASLLKEEKQRYLLAKQIINTSKIKTHLFRTPFRVTDARAFEKRHAKLKFALNIYSLDDDNEPVLVYKSMHTDFTGRRGINLLLVQGKAPHYMYITCVDRFLKRMGRNRSYVCFSCLDGFSREEHLARHVELCKTGTRINVSYPQKGEQTKFEAFDKTIPQPIFGVLDFESSLEPISRAETAVAYTCLNCLEEGPVEQCQHSTTEVHRQIPTTYSIMFTDLHGDILFSKTESDQDRLMEKFFGTLDQASKRLLPKLQRHRYKNNYTQEENERFETAQKCHLCDLPLTRPATNRSDLPVRDHCHYTNRYLGAAHNVCNLRRRMRQRIPIFVHNFKNYDSHFIIKALDNKYKASAIPSNMEKFRTLTLDKFNLVDSAELLPGALAKLVHTLTVSNHDFQLLARMPFCRNATQKQLLLRKGVYPYEWAESIEKLQDSNSLPPREDFYSALTQSHITEEDYAHAQNVFATFGCKTMLDYCELYCALDTVLLLEVMWNFRKKMLNFFNLDVTRYMSIPQLSFDCMLKTLGDPIERLSDPDMILMCEQNIRGGVSFVNTRHADCRDYNLSEEAVQDQIIYTDATNLYSVAQTDFVPVGDYEWLTDTELEMLERDILQVPEQGDKGYIMCVDLKYPEHLHEQHACMPLAPEQLDLTFEDLSPYSQACLIELQGEKRAKRYRARKLCTTLKDKKNYVIHHRTLLLYLRLGMRLETIHRAFSFRQAPVIKKYIDFCTEQRKLAVTEDERVFFKMLCNTNYGKFLQNNRNHIEVFFCTTEKEFDKRFSSPWYKGHRVIHENLTLVFWEKRKVKLDRLYAVGFTILELSKAHMYASFYDFFQPALGGPESVQLVLTDTDSLVLHVKNQSREEMFRAIEAIMDFSNYPPSHPRHSDRVKSVPGYFKDENCGNILTEVVGLKSKCYVLNVLDYSKLTDKTAVVCKGVGRSARQNLTLEAYRNCLYNISQIKTPMYCIRSKNHNVYTQRVNKVALSTTDDKRYLLDCGIHSLPHGHYSISDDIQCVRCL